MSTFEKIRQKLTVKNIPSYIILPRKTKKDKRISLNLNQYRTNHFRVNHNMKVNFCDFFSKMLGKKKTKMKGKHMLIYDITLPTGTSDLMNFGAVIDKFTCDSLVKNEILEEDDCKNIVGVCFLFNKVDRKKPHADLHIYSDFTHILRKIFSI